MTARKKLTEEEQRAIVSKRYSRASEASESELRADRTRALNSYYGKPYGNEQPGRSSIVSKDMMDTIEWMMPSLLRIFTNREAVSFDPVGPEDVDLAKQETAYVNHVLWKKNDGFMLIYNWLKEALMQKVGYVKYWWEDEKKVEYEEYTGLTDEQLTLLAQSLMDKGEIDPIAQDQADDGTWTVKFRIKRKYGCAKIEPVACDEVTVDEKCKGDIKKARTVGHLRQFTRSELLEMGFSRKAVEELTDYQVENRSIAQARDTVGESLSDDDDEEWATTELSLLECVTYLDADGDGIAELRKYFMGGNDILENEETPEIPFCSWTPYPIPFRHIGMSVYDIVEDLTRIKTQLQRALIDNVNYTNSPRVLYDQNTVDRGMLSINGPGMHIANDGPVMGAMMPIPVQPMAAMIMPVIDFFDQVEERRTGVGRMTSGVDANVLAQATKGAYTDAKSAANQRIEAIARIFAETGLAPLMSSVHRLLCRHQDWETRFQLKDKWVTVNPTEWKERANMTVAVGLGNSSHDEVRSNLQMMALAQEKAAAMPGLVQPQNVYNLAVRWQSELGFEDAGFFTDPKSPEYQRFMQSQQQGQKDPYVQGKEIETQGKLKQKAAEIQVDGIKSQQEADFRERELAQERDLAITQMELDAHVDLGKAGIGAEVAVTRGAQQESGKRAAAAGQPPAAGGGGGAAG